MLNTLIFDLDMTLVDSLEVCTMGAHLLADRFGLERKTEDQVLKAISLPTEEFWISLWGESRPEWQAYLYFEIIPRVINRTKIYPETTRLLSDAKAKGYLIGLATNRTNTWHDLANLNLAKYFDTAVGADDVRKPKPEPDMLLTVIRQLGVDPSEAIYIGDSLTDMACARSAGIRALGLLQGGAETESLYQNGASQVLPDLASCRDILDL
jgi:pyrophosphatase PpaX